MYQFGKAIVIVGMVVATGLSARAGQQPQKQKTRPAVELGKLNAEELLKQLDKDKNGYIGKDEMPPRLADNFLRLDANGDSKLDKQEIERLVQRLRRRAAELKPGDKGAADMMVTRILERLDTNKDGKISKDEARGLIAERFDRADANQDGIIDRGELRRIVARLREAQGGAARPAGPPAADFDSLDRDADGRLTRDELKGKPWAEAFDRIDANKDGNVDRKEFERYSKQKTDS